MKKIVLILGVLLGVQWAVIYTFKIPLGPKGDTGPQGPQGIPGTGEGSGGMQGFFSVVTYGAKGDGVTDDTAAIQAAIDATIRSRGTLFIPAPPNYYKITNTLNIVASPAIGTNQLWISILGQGHIDKQIVYEGPNDKAAVKIIGLKGGVIQSMKVHIADGKTNCVAYDIGTSDYANSTGGFSFVNCAATLGNGVNNKAWRLGTIEEVIGIFQILRGTIVSHGVLVSTVLPDRLDGL